MSFENKFEFNQENIDVYLKEVAKNYKKIAGKNTPAELIIIGGASVLINYGFRESTTNIDAIISAASGMKDAINMVRDKYMLPNDWLNADFKKTDSYSSRLPQFSKYYRTYSNVVTIKTISAEYLIAMKLKSGRTYKKDLSDVIGILYEHEKANNPITLESIKRAIGELYDSWNNIPELSQIFITDVFDNKDLKEEYCRTIKDEQNARKDLINFEKDYSGILSNENVNDIVGNFSAKSGRKSVIANLHEKKKISEMQNSFGQKEQHSTIER